MVNQKSKMRKKEISKLKKIEEHDRKTKITTEAIIVSVSITDQIKILRGTTEEK